MHPIERLRYVARATGADPSVLVRETAGALAAVVSDEAAGVVPACRRLIDRHLTVGPMWWLAARVLTAADPVAAAWTASDDLDRDATASHLVRHLPDEATVTVIGWPSVLSGALRRRADLEVLVADAGGEGSGLVHRLHAEGIDAEVIADAGVAAAAVVSDLVVVEAVAAGPNGVLAPSGSHSAAAVAVHSDVPVWVVAGVGRVLPEALWNALTTRLDESGDEPWERTDELVPADLFIAAIGPDGPAEVAELLSTTTAPVAAELLRAIG